MCALRVDLLESGFDLGLGDAISGQRLPYKILKLPLLVLVIWPGQEASQHGGFGLHSRPFGEPHP